MELIARLWISLSFLLCFIMRAHASFDHPLSELVREKSPWLKEEAESDQAGPMYLGAAPRELALGLPKPKFPFLPESLRTSGNLYAQAIRKALKVSTAQFETWPTFDDKGIATWVFARWRSNDNCRWQWLESSLLDSSSFTPILPKTLDLGIEVDRQGLFTPFTELPGLYDKPSFANSIIINKESNTVVVAWPPPTQMERLKKKLSQGLYVAKLLPQPARFNGKPVSFVLDAVYQKTYFPESIHWDSDPSATAITPAWLQEQVAHWPGTFDREYREQVEILSGAKVAHFFSASDHRVAALRFTQKNSAQKENQLRKIIDYLEWHYRQLMKKDATLHFAFNRDNFKWKIPATPIEIPQSSLIVKIQGSLPASKNKPVLLADHIDTAFSEDYFKATGLKKSAPGANDNATATAVLLGAAPLLSKTHPKHDIWLVHFSGEEFPADDLGARHFLSNVLKEKKDFMGMVLIDMIGQRKKEDSTYQINYGTHPFSHWMAEVALGASYSVAPSLTPLAPAPHTLESYLANTDGDKIDKAGYPVILFNQHLNFTNYLLPWPYHQLDDDVNSIDFDYATSIARVAIETTARLAQLTPSELSPYAIRRY